MRELLALATALAVGFGTLGCTPAMSQEHAAGLTKDKSAPPANKLYEDNLVLPDHANKLFLPDDAYLHWPLPAGEEAYAVIDGMAMKKLIPEITAIRARAATTAISSGAASPAPAMTG